MTQILDIGGKPVGPVKTDAKKAHDPEELKRERARNNNIFQGLMQGFVNDLSQPPDFPPIMEANVESVMDHYDGKWQDHTRVVNESSLPITLDPNALRKEMLRFTEDVRMQKLATTALNKVADLSEYHLLPLANIDRGMLYLNSRVAVALDYEGNCTVWLRGVTEPLDAWCSGWLPRPWREPVVEAANYTLGELNNLMAITRRPDVTTLNEHWMAMARTTDAAPRLPWYRRIW